MSSAIKKIKKGAKRVSKSPNGDETSPPLRKSRTDQEIVADLLDNTPESEVSLSKPFNIVTNVTTNVVYLTDDNLISKAGIKAFYNFVMGTPNLLESDRNGYIHSSTKFLLTECVFCVAEEVWEEYSHERFFQLLNARFKESSAEKVEDEIRKLVIKIDIHSGRMSLMPFFSAIREVLNRSPPDDTTHELLLVNIVLDKFKRSGTSGIFFLDRIGKPTTFDLLYTAFGRRCT